MAANAASEFDERNRLFDEVFHGRMKPEKAEAEALRLGLRPLRSEPDMSRFDPMSKATWTLAMAIAWICWRTPEQVRQCWNEFRRECWDWRFHRSRLPIDGGREWEEVAGWELKQHEEATLLSLSIMEALDEVSPEEASKVVSVKTAREQLWEALASGSLTATALKESDGGRPAQIPNHEWPYLSQGGRRDLADELHFENMPLRTEYRNVTFQRVDVVRLWPRDEGSSSLAAGAPAASSKPVRQSPQQARVVPVLDKLYPQGRPGRDSVTDGALVKAVSDVMGATAPSKETILRAAGRKS